MSITSKTDQSQISGFTGMKMGAISRDDVSAMLLERSLLILC